MGNYTTYSLFGWQSSLILWLQQKPWLCLQTRKASWEHPGLALHSVFPVPKQRIQRLHLETLTLQFGSPQKHKCDTPRYFLLRFCSTPSSPLVIGSCRGQLLSSGMRFSCFPTKYGCFRALRKRASVNLIIHTSNIIFWICRLPWETTVFCIKDCLIHTVEERIKGGPKVYL